MIKKIHIVSFITACVLSAAPSYAFKKAPPKATGKAMVTLNGKEKEYTLATEWFANTNFKDSKKTVMVFSTDPDIIKNPSRFQLIADITKEGTFEVQGHDDSQVPYLEYIARGGQVFPVKDICTIEINKALSSENLDQIEGSFSHCKVFSAGFTKTISAKFSVNQIPQTS